MLFELKFLNWIQIYLTIFKFNGIHSRLKKNEMQIGTKCIENLFMILIIHGYCVEKTDPKKQLCIILHMVLNIQFKIVTIKDHAEHLHYTNFKFFDIESPILKKLLQFSYAQKKHIAQHHMLRSYVYSYVFWKIFC